MNEVSNGHPPEFEPDEPTLDTGLPPNGESSSAERDSASVWSRLSEKTSNFLRTHFKGEVIEAEPGPIGTTDVAKALGVGMLGAAGSMLGVKSVADVARYLPQKYYTSQERARLLGTLETEAAANPEAPSPVADRAAALKSRIESSTYLTKKQKEEMMANVDAIHAQNEGEVASLEQRRSQDVARLIDAHVTTRVKGTTVVKESINTALMLTGLSAARGVAYGGVAMYERYQNVSKEMEEGKRTEGFMKEMFVNGFKENWQKLTLQGEGTRGEKLKGFAEAAGTVLRFAGFAHLASAEIQGEGISGAIEKALDQWSHKSAADFASDNFMENVNRYKDLVGRLYGAVMPSAEGAEPLATGAGMGDVHAAEAGIQTEHAGMGDVHLAEGRADGGMGDVKLAEARLDAEQTSLASHEPTLENPTLNTSAEAMPPGFVGPLAPGEVASAGPAASLAEMPHMEPSEILKDMTVHKDSGLVEMIQNQFVNAPKDLGFTGDASDAKAVAKWAHEQAMALARRDDVGILTKGSEVRLTDKAVDHLAVVVSSKDGHLEVNYLDAKTGDTLTPDALKDLEYRHMYGAPAVAEAAQPAAAEADGHNAGIDAKALLSHTDEAGKHHLEALQHATELADKHAPKVDFGGHEPQIRALLDKQGLSFDGTSIGTPADHLRIEMNDVFLDANTHEHIESVKLAFSQDGDTLVAKITNSNGSTEVMKFLDGKVSDYEYADAQLYANVVPTDSSIYTHADPGMRSIFDKMNSGDYMIRQDVTPPLVKFADTANAADKARALMEKQGLRFEPTGITSSHDAQQSLHWDSVLVDSHTKTAILEAKTITVGAEGKDLVVRMDNTDGSRDVIKYVDGKILSYQHLSSAGAEVPAVAEAAPPAPTAESLHPVNIGTYGEVVFGTDENGRTMADVTQVAKHLSSGDIAYGMGLVKADAGSAADPSAHEDIARLVAADVVSLEQMKAAGQFQSDEYMTIVHQMQRDIQLVNENPSNFKIDVLDPRIDALFVKDVSAAV